MKTLKDILLLKDRIIDLAAKLGFKDVKLFHEEAMDDRVELQLIVGQTEGSTSYKNTSYLSAMLSEMLECQTNVTVGDNIQELYQYHYNTNSVLISSEENKILKLFNASSTEQIKFKEPKNEEIDKEMRKILIQQGEETIKNTMIHKSNDSADETPELKNYEKNGERAFLQNFPEKENLTEHDVGKFLNGIMKIASSLGLDQNKILSEINPIINNKI